MKFIRTTVLIVLFAQFLIAAQVDTLHVYSKSMHKEIKALMVVPDVSADNDPLPVVYLLHGYSGHFSDWAGHMDLGVLADRYRLFLVCPEGDYNSWYFDSPEEKDSQYETHIIKELLPYVEQHFNVLKIRTGRAITGLSMGGHGALYLAIRHPKMFVAVGSMSGVVDLQYSTKRWEIAKKLGSFDQYPRRWIQNSIINMTKQLKESGLQVLLDCGVSDPFIKINRNLHQKMINASIPHTYIERPGGHSWEYWTNALEYHLLFFKHYLTGHS